MDDAVAARRTDRLGKISSWWLCEPTRNGTLKNVLRSPTGYPWPAPNSSASGPLGAKRGPAVADCGARPCASEFLSFVQPDAPTTSAIDSAVSRKHPVAVDIVGWASRISGSPPGPEYTRGRSRSNARRQDLSPAFCRTNLRPTQLPVDDALRKFPATDVAGLPDRREGA